MSQQTLPGFSVGRFDYEADLLDDGDIYLHWNDAIIRVAANPRQFRALLRHLNRMEEEIAEYLLSMGFADQSDFPKDILDKLDLD